MFFFLFFFFFFLFSFFFFNDTATTEIYTLSLHDALPISVSLKNDIKFVTKTDNPKEFAELNFLCREAGLDDYFVLDSRALMKEGVKKQRVKQELLETLQPFIKPTEIPRVTVRKKSEKSDDDPKIVR